MSDDLFPDSPRTLYGKSPLVEVTCQLRFPSVLRIETTPPADFQERVRDEFPLFERGAAIPQLPPQIAQLLAQGTNTVNYSFLTEDRNTSLALTPDSISLITSTYSRWEDFRARFQAPLRALADLYRPSFFSRIGLRYVDTIERGRLGLEGKKWSELLRPEVLGELALPQFEASTIEEAMRVIRLRQLDGRDALFLRHGLGQIQGRPEVGYVIDFDFYTDQRTEVSHAQRILDGFNHRAGRAFRWCITDQLHQALEPSDVPTVVGAQA